MITITKGMSNSSDVAKVQRALNEILYANLKEDGQFGPNSEKALQDWQVTFGHEPDGLFAGDTQRVLSTYIDKRFLTEQDYKDAAFELSCPVEHVKGVTVVESKGAGFLLGGRNVILFERHIFYSRLNKMMREDPAVLAEVEIKLGVQGIDKVQAFLLANFSDIYNSKTGGYKGTVGWVDYEWERYEKAASINARAAALSASYGLFQIMGFNYHLMAGFSSVEEMVDAFDESERNQLMGFCKFIKANPNLIKAIRSGDWLAFALGYNGPAQKGYDIKLKNAVASFFK